MLRRNNQRPTPTSSWCFATRAVVPELELLVGKARGIHFSTWARLHPDDVARDRIQVGDGEPDSPLIPAATGKHLRAEHHGLRVLCYQLGVLDTPPEHGNVRSVSLAERVADIVQIREVVLRCLRTIATTLRPKSVEARAASLRGFAGWLAATHPDIAPWPSCAAATSRSS